MLEAAPPSAACSSLTWRKPRPSWEARAARGGGRGRTRAGPRATGRRGAGQTAPPPEPPNPFAPFARRTLPPAGEGARGRKGPPPRERARQGGFASTAPSRFSQSRVFAAAARRGLEPWRSAGTPRRPWDRVRILPRRHHPMRDPVACFPKAAETKFGSIRCQGQGGEREEADGVRVLWRQQPGLVWMSKAIAQQPTLWRRPQTQRAGGRRPVVHTVGALCARLG